MKRIEIKRRDSWQEKVETVGMDYHTIDGEIYWDESACYSFTAEQIDHLEAVTDDLYSLCLDAVDHIIKNKRFNELKIPEMFHGMIEKSWENDDPSMYGRFDFSYNGTDEPRLMEFNADTPTSLLEAAVVQWYWMKDVYPDCDQFNSIHEKLMEFWQEKKFEKIVHFACLKDTEEDLGNIEYMRDVAFQAGYVTRHVYIDDIGWSDEEKCFLDSHDEKIETIFKLYPWEWLFTDEFGKNMIDSPWKVIEPAWKSILSNKAILPVLWELNPDHPNLLPAYFTDRFGDNYVRKPLYSREGESIVIVKNGNSIEKPGTYGSEGYIYQQYSPLPEFSGNFPSVGSWIVNGKAAGLGIREDRNEITSNTSRFIPHMFK